MAGFLTALLSVGVSGCFKSATPSSPSGVAAPQNHSSIRFGDVTADSGIRFRHNTGADGRFLMPESIGSGGALFDYDGDGWLDVLLVNGAPWADRPGKAATPHALYRNLRNGSFQEVTREAGLTRSFYGLGCAVGDYDNDGDEDLLLTGLSENRLYENRGGAFRDVTAGSGLAVSKPWGYHTSAAWLDYDRDGLLDLFICRYVEWSPTTDVPCISGAGKRIYCGPNRYGEKTCLLYRNRGGGRFEDVSARTGVSGYRGKSLGVLPVDENGDGWPDLLVTNDTTPNRLLRNEQGKRFTDVAAESGIAVDENGRARAGMGVDVADVRNEGGLSFGIGNFSNEGLSLYQKSGPVYLDSAPASGLVAPSLPQVTFGLTFLDADRDGWTDLFTYNGHVDASVGDAGGMITYKQRPQLFRNEGAQVDAAFTEVGAQAGATFTEPQLGRGCAWGDIDNDGQPDLLLCENGGPARLLRNATGSAHHWLGIRLKGMRGNRNAYGAEVRLTTGGRTQRRWIRSGGSYLSHSDSRALFGLGTATAIERLEVRWPSGKSTVIPAPALDRYADVAEP